MTKGDKNMIKKEKNQLKNSSYRQSEKSAKNKTKIITDVLGSYTGIPKFGDKPEQDADDL